MERAFRQNGIEFRTLQSTVGSRNKAIKEFTSEAGVNVLILHAQSQSAGLTLTCAQTIILLEPLLTASHECVALASRADGALNRFSFLRRLQAIHRVHRYGQRSETKGKLGRASPRTAILTRSRRQCINT